MNNEQPEAVYTVTDFYDGLRGGVASCHGTPHLYQSQFEDIEGGSESFLVQPIDAETFRLAMEDWAIWCRWERAFHAGHAPAGSHPALPDDRQRHAELTELLRSRLTLSPERTQRVCGRFEVVQPGASSTTSPTQYVVHWMPCDDALLA